MAIGGDFPRPFQGAARWWVRTRVPSVTPSYSPARFQRAYKEFNFARDWTVVVDVFPFSPESLQRDQSWPYQDEVTWTRAIPCRP